MAEAAAPPRTFTRWLPYTVLMTAVTILSFGAIFVRYAQAEGVPSMAIAALRVLFAAGLLAPLVVARHAAELRRIAVRDAALAGLAGALLALALTMMFFSLEHTTILLTNLMTNSSPLWVAIMEVAILKAFLSKRVWMGILLALAGMVMFALAGLDGGGDMGSDPILGGGIALLSAFIAAIYFIVGRTVRARVSTLVFLWIGLVAGAGVMLVINLVAGTSLTGYSLEGYALILIVTITGQLVGQAMLAYCLAHFPATFVSIALQMLVILSALEAFFVFGEQPGPLQILASVVILAGVIMVITGRNPVLVKQ